MILAEIMQLLVLSLIVEGYHLHRVQGVVRIRERSLN